MGCTHLSLSLPKRLPRFITNCCFSLQSFFASGMLDELIVDAVYFWNRLTGRIRTPIIREDTISGRPLSGMAAILIPAWQEDAVIGPMLVRALASWPQDELRIYVGCYRNDPFTIASVMAASRGNDRVRVVMVGEDGLTCKAHCLNWLYEALSTDETRCG